MGVLDDLYNTQQRSINAHTNSINGLTVKDGELENAIKDNTSDIKALQNTVNRTHSSTIHDHTNRIEYLEDKTGENYAAILALKGVDTDLRASIGINSNNITELTTAVTSLVESDRKY